MTCELCGTQDYVESSVELSGMVLCWDCLEATESLPDEERQDVSDVDRLVAVVPTVVRDQFGDPARIHRYVDIAPHRLWWWLAQPAVQIVERDCLLWHPSDDAFDHRS